MKTNLDQMKLADYGLTEISAQEAVTINGGGIIDGMWWGFWGGVLNIVDTLSPGSAFIQNLIMAIVGKPPGRP